MLFRSAPVSELEKGLDVDLDGLVGSGLLASFRVTLVDGGRTMWLEDLPPEALENAPALTDLPDVGDSDDTSFGDFIPDEDSPSPVDVTSYRLMQEQIDQGLGAGLLTEPWVVQDGHIALPTKPGLGIEINEAEVRKHPFQQELLQRVIYPDGSVGDW